ncbi:conserved hypothetical protein [Agrobacterium sp. NCPPB 925]|uniref:hypothetical protein n=1 Tax=Agrobacterium genomosp. 6 TaxID=1183411 RepID=UPI0009C9C552|nr:hypothetical protein [Agrobacterium genomosp. 6]CUX71477.1 conserved hypothetical protein [Agrobacterium sp. NCPPB 925]
MVEVSGARHFIGDHFEAEFAPESVFVGLDSYRLENVLGHSLSWVSYTLTSNSPPPNDRWWLVYLPDGNRYAFTHSKSNPLEFSPHFSLTGLVKLVSEGDATLSGSVGSLHMFRDENDHFHCVELFKDTTRLLTMYGKPL